MGYADTVEKIQSGNWSEATEAERAKAVRDVVEVCSVAAAAVAIQPIPFLDFALLPPIQIAMVQCIARIHGYTLDKKSVIEIMGSFGAGLVTQGVIMSAAKFVPFVGWVAAIAMGYSLTYAVGEVSHHYFATGRGLPNEELSAMFDRIYKSKRAEKEAAHRGASSLKDKLAELTRAFEAGLITKEQFDAKKEELLRAF